MRAISNFSLFLFASNIFIPFISVQLAYRIRAVVVERLLSASFLKFAYGALPLKSRMYVGNYSVQIGKMRLDAGGDTARVLRIGCGGESGYS